MRKALVCVFLLSCALFVSSAMGQQAATPATASAPNLINFSGTLADLNGNPLTGVQGVTFLLYTEQQGGNPLWMETQNITPGRNGRYTATLGVTTARGLPTDIFSNGEARWLAVQVVGQPEQARVLLVAVPYALKASDAQTVGGLPPSAFVLAAPVANTIAGELNQSSTTSSVSAPPTTSNVTTTGGTLNTLPLWTTATNIQSSAITQTGSGSTAKIGIGTTTPAAALDVNGAETVRGTLTLAATGVATATAGKNSQPENLVASSFSSSTSTAVNQTFQWRAEPAANNTAKPSGTLNLLYGLGATIPSETGLKVSSKGLFTFATGQTFPGTGSVTSVGLSAPSADFTVSGSPITKSGSLNLNWNIAPTPSDTANSIVKRDTSGNFSGTTITATGQLVAQALSGNGAAIEASSAASNATVIYGGAASSTGATWGVEGETFSNDAGASGVVGIAHDVGVGVTGLNTAAGGVAVKGSNPKGFGFVTDSNVQQARTMGGWVKAMAFVNGADVWGTVGVVNCFNSNLSGAAATTPPCGFTFSTPSHGTYIIDFGFQVDDRFFSFTNVIPYASFYSSVCTDSAAAGSFCSVTANQVQITVGCPPNLCDTQFYLLMY